MLTIVRTETGRIEAPEGGHDDDMMGLAIAHEAREQVIFPNEPIYVKPEYHFNIERKQQTHYDYGERIVVV